MPITGRAGRSSSREYTVAGATLAAILFAPGSDGATTATFGGGNVFADCA